MKIIDFNTIRNLKVSPQYCVNWVDEALRIKYSSQLPKKISLVLNQGKIFYNTMPCLIPEIKRFGVKEVTRYPDRTPSISGDMLLYDLNTGALLTLMDGNWITAMRTGAVAAHSINLLKKEGALNYSFLGLGNTARATLLCLISSNPSRVFNVKLLKYKNQAEEFILRFSDHGNLSFTIVDNKEELIRGADVIVSCVTVAEDLIGEDEWFEKGVLVVPIHTRGFQNCDLFFDKVFADDEDHVKNFKYFNDFKQFSEVAKVVLGYDRGRENNEERILIYNIGIALHDVYFASKIYDLVRLNISDNIALNTSLENFWI